MTYVIFENVTKDAIKKAIEVGDSLITFLEPTRSNVWEIESYGAKDAAIWFINEKDFERRLDISEETRIVSDKEFLEYPIIGSLEYLVLNE